MSSPLREVLLTIDATHQIWRKPPVRTCVHQQIHAQCRLHADALQDVEGASVNKDPCPRGTCSSVPALHWGHNRDKRDQNAHPYGV